MKGRFYRMSVGIVITIAYLYPSTGISGLKKIADDLVVY
jgi:hypothetical protein